jgi:hypothetical protein
VALSKDFVQVYDESVKLVSQLWNHHVIFLHVLSNAG